MTIDIFKHLQKSKQSKPLICLEVNPPRGVDCEAIFERLEGKLAGVDFLNVTDSALARMRFSALPFAALLKNKFGIEPLVNISCRDRNLIALQADLLAGWGLGVRSVVALTGDAVTIGDAPDTKGVFEVNSVGLLQAIRTLNAGHDLVGNDLQGAPQYLPGVVVNPNVKNPAVELKRLERKVAAGAAYALSQPVFDVETSTAFFRSTQSIGIPILMGLMAFRSSKAALNIVNVPGLRLSEEMRALVTAHEGEDFSELSIAHCLKLAAANSEFVAGFHVVSGTTPKLALKLTQQLVEERKKRFPEGTHSVL